MITYKNISFSAKTFYGTRFAPGEIKSVPGYINSRGMVRITAPKQPTKTPIFGIPSPEHTRGRKKKSSDSEKDSVADIETKIEISKEETTDGNPS